MKDKDGGPAFPGEVFENERRERLVMQPGMSLRDWFAGQALAATALRHINIADMPSVAYSLADKMLAERENGE